MVFFEKIFYLFLAGVGIYVIHASQNFSSGIYTTVLGGILGVCSIVQFLRTIKKTKPIRTGDEKERERQKAVFYTILVTIGYLVLLKPLGFIISSMAYMSGLMWLHGYRRLILGIAFSILFSVGLYLFFTHIVHISLPKGILFL